jgi:hypothetical protein
MHVVRRFPSPVVLALWLCAACAFVTMMTFSVQGLTGPHLDPWRVTLATPLLCFAWASATFGSALYARSHPNVNVHRLPLGVFLMPVPAHIAVWCVQTALTAASVFLFTDSAARAFPLANRPEIAATFGMAEAAINILALFASLLWPLLRGRALSRAAR